MRVGWCLGLVQGILATVVTVALCPGPADASINLELRPITPSVNVGQQASVGIYAVSDGEGVQLLAAYQLIFTWNTSVLRLDSPTNAGGAPMSLWGFLGDPYGINEHNPPADGNAIIFGLDQPGNPIGATSTGTLLSTLRFTGLAPAAFTPITVLASAGSPVGRTQVLDGTIPNTDVTGTISGTSITVVPAPAAAPVMLVASHTLLRRPRRSSARRVSPRVPSRGR